MTEAELAIFEKRLDQTGDPPPLADIRVLIAEVRSLWADAAARKAALGADPSGNGRPPDGAIYCPHHAPGEKPHVMENLRWKIMEEPPPGGRTFYLFYCGACGRAFSAQAMHALPKLALAGADILPFSGRGQH